MVAPWHTLFDPTTHERDLARCETFTRFRRWHANVVILAADALIQGTLSKIARHNGGRTIAVRQRAIADIQTKVGLAVLGIGPVTLVAGVSQNRPDVAAIVDGRAGFVGVYGLRGGDKY